MQTKIYDSLPCVKKVKISLNSGRGTYTTPNSCFSIAVSYNSLLADLAACRHVIEV